MNVLSCSLFMILVLVSRVVAQTIVTPTPIHIASLSPNQQWVVYADAGTVYLAKTANLEVVDQWSYSTSNQGNITQLSFLEGNSDIIRIQYSLWNGDFSPMDISVYPRDSVIFYNHKEKKRVTSIPGNMMIAYAAASNRYGVIANDYMKYPYQGKEHYGARAGMLGLFPEDYRHRLTKVAMRLTLSPDGNQVALVLFDSLNNGTSHYSVEVRKFHDFSLIAKKTNLTQKPSTFQFSSNGQYLIYQPQEKGSNYNDQPVWIWNSSTLTPANSTEHDTVNAPPFIRQNKQVEMLDRGMKIIKRNLINKEIEWTLWPRLTEVYHKGILPLDDRYVFVYGDEMSVNGLYSGKGALKKIDLEELSIYTKNEAVKRMDTIYHPKYVRIQENTILTENFTVSDDGQVLVGTHENLLEVWSTESRKKLMSYRFSNDIKAYPDGNGQFILIFEKYVQISYSEFKVHVLDLKQGILTSQIVQNDEVGFINPNYKCDCFALPNKPASWICNDRGTSFWSLSSNNLFPQKLLSVGVTESDKYSYKIDRVQRTLDPEILQFQMSRRLWAGEQYHAVGLWQVNSKTKEVKEIENPNLSKAYWQLSSDMWIQSSDQEVQLITKSSRINLLSTMDKISYLDISAHREKVAVFYRASSSTDSVMGFVVNIPTQKIEHRFVLPNTDNYSFTGTQIHYRFGENLYTWILGNSRSIGWDKADFNPESYKTLTHERDLQFDNNEFMLLRGSVLLNLTDLQTRVVLPSYKFGGLLKGKQEGYLVYRVDSTYQRIDGTYGSKLKYPFYHMVVASVNQPEKPIARSEMIRLSEGEGIHGELWVSNTGRYVAYTVEGYTDKGMTHRLNLLDIETMEVETLTRDEVESLMFSPNDQFLVWGFLKDPGTTQVRLQHQRYELRTGKQKSMHSGVFDGFYKHDDQILQATQGGVVIGKVSADSVQRVRFLYSKEFMTCATYLADQNLIAAGSDQGTVFFWDPEKSTPLSKVACGYGEIKKMIVTNNRLFVLMANMRLAIIDLTTRKLTLTGHYQQNESGEVSLSWFTPEGYYWVERDQVRRYHFVRGSQAFALSSFEIKLNRPDMILNRVGFSSPELVNSFYEAYRKRLARYPNYSETMDWEVNLPSLKIDNKDQLPALTRNPEFALNVLAKSDKSLLKAIHVYVNGVPVNGRQGIPTGSVNEFQTQVSFQLSSGLNSIRVMAEDEGGVESFPESHEVELQSEYIPKVYYIGVGVSHYRDSSMNLKYADEDVRRMTNNFDWRYKDRLSIDTLLNEHVTVENLLALKEKLTKTHVDDYVIISFSGHGLLDKKMNFYFAGHDMDFNEPEKRGISYAQIESLTDLIPARRKLLLIDACHSGEVDSEQEASTSSTPAIKVYQTKGATAETVAQNTSSFRLMQSLFSDVTHSNGTFVISASSGDEFAYESDSWKGGVFTYSFLHTLNELYSETRSGDTFRISTLRNRVNDMVIGLTQNRQRPTSRAENLDWNWRFVNSE